MAKFLDHYAHERYDEALQEMQATILPEDFRAPLFLAATYGQLGRQREAAEALEDLARIWPFPNSQLRSELIERHAHSEGLTDHLLEGLEKAGLDLGS